MNNKVIMAAIITAAIGISTTASANTGTIIFNGAISSSTCDFNVAVDGVMSPTGVVDLGTFKASDVTAVGGFGTAKNVSLVPDSASCDVDPAGANASVAITSQAVSAANTDVLVSPDTDTTNAGVEFKLASGQSVINKSGIALTSGTADLDASGAVNFTAQAYALSSTVNAGNIGGSLNYSVAYL
ncbi:TPA: type 1 fimbrial protein [Enterobacter hormaechei subsp. steigerwaltii]|nr:type 1 fimbrial protein [Enterobacter hormaechei subsp. steigerwaltii]